MVWLHNIYSYLAPTDTGRSEILVVEGWLSPHELSQAIKIYKTGNYSHVMTTGGPNLSIPENERVSNYADFAADYLARHGIPRQILIAVPAPTTLKDRTYISAIELRDHLYRSGMLPAEIDLFSAGPHSRRSRLLFQMALGEKTRVNVISAHPHDYDPDVWWHSSSGTESIIVQTIGLLWVKCCFWP